MTQYIDLIHTLAAAASIKRHLLVVLVETIARLMQLHFSPLNVQLSLVDLILNLLHLEKVEVLLESDTSRFWFIFDEWDHSDSFLKVQRGTRAVEDNLCCVSEL